MACSAGTFHDLKNLKCKVCVKGSYQDKEGQTSCKACEEGKSTNTTGAVSSDECLEGNTILEEANYPQGGTTL